MVIIKYREPVNVISSISYMPQDEKDDCFISLRIWVCLTRYPSMWWKEKITTIFL